jgi:hypothetical protein
MYWFRRVYRHRQVVDEIHGACWLLSTGSKRSEDFAFRTPTTTMAAQLEDSLSSLGLAIHEGRALYAKATGPVWCDQE